MIQTREPALLMARMDNLADPTRLRLDWVSAAEAPRFAEVTKEFVETVRALGPLSQEVPRTEGARTGGAQ